MSESTVCPYCSAKLRLGSSSRHSHRVKCRVCKRTFRPSLVVADRGQGLPLNEPLSFMGAANAKTGTVDSESAPAHESTESPPPSVAQPSETSIDPNVVQAAFPERHGASKPEHHGDRVRERVGRHHHRRISAFNLGMTVGLVVVGIGAASYLGWNYLRPSEKAPTHSERPMAASNEETKLKSILETELAPKPLPRRLFGIWDLRADDERRGWIEYHENGTLVSMAWKGGVAKDLSKSNWYLVEEVGDNLVIELGPERGTLGNVQYYISLTGPDAYTLTEVRQKGWRTLESQRFVRRTASPTPKAPGS